MFVSLLSARTGACIVELTTAAWPPFLIPILCLKNQPRGLCFLQPHLIVFPSARPTALAVCLMIHPFTGMCFAIDPHFSGGSQSSVTQCIGPAFQWGRMLIFGSLTWVSAHQLFPKPAMVALLTMINLRPLGLSDQLLMSLLSLLTNLPMFACRAFLSLSCGTSVLATYCPVDSGTLLSMPLAYVQTFETLPFAAVAPW